MDHKVRRMIPQTTAMLALGVLIGCTSTPSVPDSLSADDLRAMQETAQNALESNRIGQSANWSNTATGNLGTVTPTRTFQRDNGTPCRDFQLTATASGRTAIGYDTACRSADGAWVSQDYDSLVDALRYSGNRNYNRSTYVGVGSYRCRGAYSYRYRDPWCRTGSGVSFGVGTGF